MRTIIVCTDFSASASNAASYAASMAMAVKADLFLLHAYEPPASSGEISLPIDVDTWQKDAETALRSLQQDLQEQTNGLLSVRGQVHMGSFYFELETVCRQMKPYAVVIGSTGKTAAERILFGSNAVYTMKHLHWPVIAVPQGISFKGIHRIGLACDLENVPGSLPMDELVLLQKDFQAELHLLYIGERNNADPEVKMVSSLMDEKIWPSKMKFHFLQDNDIDKGIMEFAEKKQIDLLIVLPKRKSFINALLSKSHTRQFVLHSHVAVMALHSVD